MVRMASSEAIKNAKHKMKKSLGQNFLNNDEIVSDIQASVNPNQSIMEIGPGIGALTQKLLELEQKVLCVELDDSLIQPLIKTFGNNPQFSLWHQDCLDVSLEQLQQHFDNQQISVVANIPYYITTPIIKKIVNDWSSVVDEAILMVQEEVAKRICASPCSKAYGSLSVYVQTKCDAQYLFKVGKENFVPQPKVDSAIIKIIKDNRYQLNWEGYSNFLQNCFSQKRKTLINNLATSYNIAKPKVAKWLDAFGLTKTIRAEEISVEQFVILYNNLKELHE